MNNIRSSTAPISRIIKYCVICLISLRSVFTAIKCISEPFCAFLYTDRNDRVPFPFIQLFRERLSEKVHATIPKGIVGGFEFTVLERMTRGRSLPVKAIIGSTPPGDLHYLKEKLHVYTINDIQLLKMYRLSCKSLGEQEHPRL